MSTMYAAKTATNQSQSGISLISSPSMIDPPAAAAHKSIIGVQPILPQHALRVEKRAVKSDRMAHYVEEIVAIVAEEGHDDLCERIVKRCGVIAVIRGHARPAVRRPERTSP
jgi:hypothetical protein